MTVPDRIPWCFTGRWMLGVARVPLGLLHGGALYSAAVDGIADCNTSARKHQDR